MIKRLKSLALRTVKDIELFFQSLAFTVKYRAHNSTGSLFNFRKAIETGHLSPFRNAGKLGKEPVSLSLPQFGNAMLDFDLSDPFQMAICEEFVKHKIYDLSLIDFVPAYSIDCGAYRGYFTLLMTEKFPTCKKICVEPHPENYKSLQATMQKNNIGNVTLYNNALSTVPGTIPLELWGSNMARNENVTKWNHIVDVETIDLYNILGMTGDKVVLKVDIEGGELDYFPAVIPDLPPTAAVYLETHDGWNSLKPIQQEFEENGFSFSILRDRGLYIDSFAIRKQVVK